MAEKKKDAEIADVQSFDNLARDHVTQPAAVTDLPPAGGKHSQTPQNCGAYSKPVANENAIHSLEHGAVWIAYQPTLRMEAVNPRFRANLLLDSALAAWWVARECAARPSCSQPVA